MVNMDAIIVKMIIIFYDGNIKLIKHKTTIVVAIVKVPKSY